MIHRSIVNGDQGVYLQRLGYGYGPRITRGEDPKEKAESTHASVSENRRFHSVVWLDRQ